MSKEKNKESGSKTIDTDRRFRWGILGCVTILFLIILFPSLVITKHQYNLGDVAERDIKSPRDFFIEDKAATELNRQKAVEEVLTVYDYDPGLGDRLTRKVDEAFAKLRAAAAPLDDANIDRFTRTMTTAIVLSIDKAEFPLALALGIVLLSISLSINVLFQYVQGGGRE